MRAIIPTQSITLKELLSSSVYFAKLFTNDLGNCEDLPSDFQFQEPSYTQYHPILLSSNSWTLSTTTSSYSQCNYKESLIWGNTSANTSETIFGYFVTDANNNTVWFGKFDSSVEIQQNQNIVVDVKVHLNNYDYPQNTIAMIVKGNGDEPGNVNVYIENVKWGEIGYPLALMDLMDSNWTPNKNILCIGVDNKINICQNNPLSFDITVNAINYNEHKENIIIEDTGKKIIEINLQTI